MSFLPDSIRMWFRVKTPSPGGASAATGASRISAMAGVWVWLGVGLLAFLQLWVNVGYVGRGVEFIVSNVTIDDTYYYLQTAWNHAELGFPTFDGRHATNGVQALWYFFALALAFVADSKEGLLHLTLYAAIALTALCYIPIVVIGRSIGRVSGLVCLVFGWLFLNVRYRIFLTGMENALHALILWAILTVGMIVVQDVKRGRARLSMLLFLALLLSLNVWCRVDAALLSLAVYGYIGWLLFRHLGRRAALRFLVPAALIGGVFAVLLLLTYYAMAGTPLPISGQIKNATFHLDGAVFFQNVWRGLRFTTPYLANVSNDSVRRSIVILVGLAAIVAGSVAARRRFAADEPTRTELAAYRAAYGPYVGLFGVFVITSIVQMIYLAGLGQFAVYGLWYITAYLIICLVGFAMLGDWVWLNIRCTLFTFVQGGSARTGIQAAGVILLALSMVAIKPHPHHWVSQDRLLKTHHHARYQLAQQLSAQLPAYAVVAAWNAGELGFFMEHPVINLDGLVNDYAYYRDVLSGDVALPDYLDREGVTHILDSDVYIPDMPLNRWAIVQEWPIEEGGIDRLILLASVHNPAVP